MDDRGISIIEMIVVVIILALASAMAIPNISRWLESYTVRKAARQVVTDLQFAKMKSVAEGVQYRVVIDPATDTAVIEKGNSSSGSNTWVQVGLTRDLRTESNPYYAKNVDISTNLSGGGIVFSPIGTASPAATVTLASTNFTRTVTVLLTGRVMLD